MIKIEKTEVVGWEAAIRGMRNPKNSWDRSDSECLYHMVENYRSDDPKAEEYTRYLDEFDLNLKLGPNDHDLMTCLAAGGPVHAKYRRMIVVYVDITAPLYWWKEFDTYKVGTVANSCSTMHKIHEKEFTLDDFSHEQLISNWINNNVESFVSFGDALNFEPKVDWSHGKEYNLNGGVLFSPKDILSLTIHALNACRQAFLTTKDKKFWWQMIQLLPSSYNQKRTVMLNYEVLAGLYPMRKNHKLDEWHDFCKWIEELPYSELIVGKEIISNDNRGWRPISEYKNPEFDWVLLKIVEPNGFEWIPVVAEQRQNDGIWHNHCTCLHEGTDDRVIEVPAGSILYFIDMQQLDKEK